MQFFTDFADQAVILPAVLAIGVTLAVLGWYRGAIAWLVGIGGTFTVMLSLKLLFIACHRQIAPDVGLRTPSGHTAAAAIVVGALIALTTLRSVNRTTVAVLSAVTAAVLIGASRLALGVHTLAEVIAGGLVGSLGAVLLVLLAGQPPPDLRTERLAAVVLAVVILFHGFHLPAEAEIHRTAELLRMWPLSVCR